jgi:hypothetical protein
VQAYGDQLQCYKDNYSAAIYFNPFKPRQRHVTLGCRAAAVGRERSSPASPQAQQADPERRAANTVVGRWCWERNFSRDTASSSKGAGAGGSKQVRHTKHETRKRPAPRRALGSGRYVVCGMAVRPDDQTTTSRRAVEEDARADVEGRRACVRWTHIIARPPQKPRRVAP